ncbi:hypothetical protein [Tabrizicola caldifontis]|uniref:hypothetical protein n=1 Tax=Tabrizicola caldifontis TaxID=2528036 RepID=UPI001080A98A|nr:hypothetical protein [Rhodobacter sp. YIM 73028]
MKLFVGKVSFATLPPSPARRDERRSDPAEAEVDKVIAAGRLATRTTPEFNGFLASLAGKDVDSRIREGIASGGRRIVPVGD